MSLSKCVAMLLILVGATACEACDPRAATGSAPGAGSSPAIDAKGGGPVGAGLAATKAAKG